jgi:hypothetical protein
LRQRVHAVDDHIDVAVVVVVAEGAASPGNSSSDAGATFVGDILEAAVAQVAIEILTLGVRGFCF